jgi:hypothetical protein
MEMLRLPRPHIVSYLNTITTLHALLLELTSVHNLYALCYMMLLQTLT